MSDNERLLKFAYGVMDSGRDAALAVANGDLPKALEWAEAAAGDSNELVTMLEERLEEPSP